MIRNGEITMAEVKRIFRRYWWIPAFITLTLGALGLAASLVLPKKYKSTRLVLVEQTTVPKDVIKPVVADDLNQRMASMKAQILSRSRLESIINKFGLYPQERQTAHMEDLVDKLKNAIDVALIQPMAGAVNNEPPGFNVSVTFDNPQFAQQICQEITSMFMEQNATVRVAQSNKTTQFLTEQMNEAKAKLEEQDKRLAQFKAEHLVSMPEQEQTNITLLSGMNTQLHATTQALTRAQQDKSLNETLLTNKEATCKPSQYRPHNPETTNQEMIALQQQLSTLLAKYTPEHPDVIKVRAQINELNRRMAEAPAPKVTPTGAQAALREPPAIQQLRTRIKQDEFTITELTKRQSQIQDQIRTLHVRLQP